MSQDYLKAGRIAHAFPPSGEYLAEIVPGSARNALYRTGTGVDFEVEIKEGGFAGRRLGFHLLLEGRPEHDFITDRNWRVLSAWADSVGAKPAADAAGVIREIWEASRKRRVWFKLKTKSNPSTGFSSIAIVDVRVESEGADDAYPF